MRLLLASTSAVMGGDGREAAGSFVHDFLEALQNCGIDSAVVAPGLYGDAAASTSDSGFVHFPFEVPRLPLSLLRATHPRDWPAIRRTLVAGQRAVDEAARAFRPTHLLALWALPSGHWVRRTAARHSLPYAIWALGSDIWTLGRIAPIRPFLKRVLDDADWRFADGYRLCEEVEAIGGGECDFMPSSRRLDFGPRYVADHAPLRRLVFLGRWHLNKGVDLLLDALEGLDESDWNLIDSVTLAGGGPLERQVISRSRALSEQGRPCSTSGYLDRREAAALLDGADFVIIPSRIESIPVIFSDAMQAGKAVVATPAGDLRRLIATHDCGICANAIDAASLRQALRRALREGPACHAEGVGRARQAFDLHRTAHFLRTRLETDRTGDR